jgi:type II secretory pathway pseudopilin PulG
MVVIAVLGGLVVLVLLVAFLLDRKARRRGHAVRSADAIQLSIKTARAEQRALNRLRRAHPDGKPKW